MAGLVALDPPVQKYKLSTDYSVVYDQYSQPTISVGEQYSGNVNDTATGNQ